MENEAVNTVEEIEDEQENQPEAESPEERREREAREKKEAQARVFRARKRKLIHLLLCCLRVQLSVLHFVLSTMIRSLC